jgi:hypothetical protein
MPVKINKLAKYSTENYAFMIITGYEKK